MLFLHADEFTNRLDASGGRMKDRKESGKGRWNSMGIRTPHATEHCKLKPSRPYLGYIFTKTGQGNKQLEGF